MPCKQVINKSYFLSVLSLDFAPAEKVLENTGLTVAYLEKNQHIDISSAIQVVKNLYKYSHSPIWPGLFGKHLGVTGHGPVGYAALSAPTLGHAIKTLMTWEQVRSAYAWEILEQQEDFEVLLHDTTGDATYEAFNFEASMSLFEVLIPTILGGYCRSDVKINFKEQSKDKEQDLVAFYQSQLFFGQDKNSILIPKALWSSPSPLYDKESHELNVNRCKQLFEQLNQNVELDILVANIIAKHFDQSISAVIPLSAVPSQAQLCAELHLSGRTLMRKLKTANTSYKQILETERRIYATTLLKDARFTVLKIADILGYSEVANFCRAFKTWYGVSPTMYRQSLGDM